MKRKTLFLAFFSLCVCAQAQHFNPTGQTLSAERHSYVDLGLPSGTLWATENVGASSSKEVGDYFAWGETQPKKMYTWATYKFWQKNPKSTWFHDNLMTKYCTRSEDGKVDNKKVLDAADDAATKNWGSPWYTPTQEQWEELLYNCEWSKVDLPNGNREIHIRGKNGKVMILPCGEFMEKDYNWSANYWGANKNKKQRAYYWTSTLGLDQPLYAFCMFSIGDNAVTNVANGESRYQGMLVRPVRPVLSKGEREGRQEFNNDIREETMAVEEMMEELPSLSDKTDEAQRLLYRPVPDYWGAIKLLKEAASHNDSNAAWMLAQLYWKGTPMKNLNAAWDYARQSSNLGNPIGKYWLAVLYDHGEGSPIKNYKERMKQKDTLYEEAKKGLLNMVNERQGSLDRSAGIVIDHAFVYDYLGRLADMDEDMGLTKDYYEKAAELGNCHAQSQLGNLIVFGSFDDFNYDINSYYIDGPSLNLVHNGSDTKALNYFQQAANRGDPYAQNMLGIMIKQMLAKDNPQSYYAKEAAKSFENNLSHPTPYGVYNLAYCYEHGYGVEKNIQKALELYKKAAGLGCGRGKEQYQRLKSANP